MRYLDLDGDGSKMIKSPVAPLRNVKQIQATQFAFAAILSDERVVTWGDAQCGGDSSGVQNQLRSRNSSCESNVILGYLLVMYGSLT